MALSDIGIRNLKPSPKPRKVADKDGLYLYVTPKGSKIWRWDYRFHGKRYTRTFGKWPAVGLARARQMRADEGRLLERGVDPRLGGSADLGESFKEVGERWLATKEPRWAEKTKARNRGRIEQHLYPFLGPRPIASIEPPELLTVLRRAEEQGLGETVHRLRNYAGKIFRFAIAEGLAERDPSQDIADALTPAPKNRNRASLDESELPGFFGCLSSAGITNETRDAMELTILTASRTNEVRFADASEFEGLDGAEPLWRVPPERMKMGRAHLVPLSRQAAEVVRRRVGAGKPGLLFAAPTRSGVISENRMLFALYEMGYRGRATMHGFRGTFSTIANEHEWNRDWIEMCLAHVQGGVRGVYNSAQYLKGRRELLQWWADYLDEQRLKGAQQTR